MIASIAIASTHLPREILSADTSLLPPSAINPRQGEEDLPDLAFVGTIQIVNGRTGLNEPLLPGDNAIISVVWRNQGTGPALSFTVRMLVTNPSGGVFTDTVIGQFLSLDPGQNQSTNVSLPIPLNAAPGTYTVAVTLDSGGVVNESDETNNEQSTAFQVSGSQEPTFDICIQDNRSNNTLRWNSTTGAYEFVWCDTGAREIGVGQVTSDGCVRRLKDTSGGRNVIGQYSGCKNNGTGTVRVPSIPNRTFRLTDSNTLNNTCNCGG